MKFTRARGVGLLGIFIAIVLIFAVNNSLGNKITEKSKIQSIWGFTSTIRIPDSANMKEDPKAPPVATIELPTMITISLICGALVLAGGTLIAKNPERGWVAPYMSSVIALGFFSILLWAVANNSVDLSDTLSRVVRLGTPIAIGALAGIVCERSGVVNIGIEGMMLTAACFGYAAAAISARAIYGDALPESAVRGVVWMPLIIGILGAILTGGMMAALHAWLSIRFKVDQVISGTVINIMAVGITGFTRTNFLLKFESPLRTGLPQMPLGPLADIPLLGPILFDHKPITYLMILMVFGLNFFLFRTVWGLRTRAIGEHPKAADTVGINVNRMRYRNVIIGGMIAGVAGAWFSLEGSFGFDDGMTSGQGFISLAAMIFGKWNPIGAFGGSLLFSSADALQLKVQAYSFDLPSQFMQMLPYVVTLIVLAGVIGRARPPAASGKVYEK